MRIYRLVGEAKFLTPLNMDIHALVLANSTREAKKLAKTQYGGDDVDWHVEWSENVKNLHNKRVLELRLR